MKPRRRSVVCIAPSGLHRLSYVEWGDPANARVLLCAHALTRAARDFDRLAQALSDAYRVVCPDFPGRGESDRLADPNDYQIPTYIADAVTLIARLDVESVDWVGTSMGGLVGMGLAAMAGTPIRRLVLNEAGPVVRKEALERIGLYLGQTPRFDSFADAEAHVRAVSAPFGPHSDDEWRFLTENVMRRAPDGRWEPRYDPAIAVPFKAMAPHQDVDLWHLYDAIRAPTLVIRGTASDLLAAETVVQMRTRGPGAQTVELSGIGHAPTLLHAEQIALVRAFLLG